jgi:hypothetical protein
VKHVVVVVVVVVVVEAVWCVKQVMSPIVLLCFAAKREFNNAIISSVNLSHSSFILIE